MNLTHAGAIVAGGASGLGAATARALAERGARVAIVDLDGDRAQALAEELGGDALAFGADVSSEPEMEAAVSGAVDAFGSLRFAVSCAGIGHAERTVGRGGPAALESFERVVRVNLIGTFNVLRLAAEAMVATEPVATPLGGPERGVIVNTASVAAFEGQIGQPAYSASKGAVAAMTLPIARELARSLVRVVTIAPGIFETPMMAGLPQEAQDSLGAQVPHPSRLGKPAEYANLVAHIVDNAMLNGETIRLDGAIRMGPR
jgi:NAD(P)-dependent dehydrogenase (short-subunit alcohol dehydrogenase family)